MMESQCGECLALASGSSESPPHRGLVETAPVIRRAEGMTQDERLQSFMCLGCGCRWSFDARRGWQPLDIETR